MFLAQNILSVLHTDLGVGPCRGDMTVSQELLDMSDVGTSLQEVCCAAMPQAMR
jgi:hypothetical protein